jgi:hypothetical protein
MPAHKIYLTEEVKQQALKRNALKWRKSKKGKDWQKKHNKHPNRKKWCTRWQKRNKGIANANTAAYRSRKQKARQGSKEAIAKIYARAAELRALGLPVEVDHRVALANGGDHTPANLRIISAVDNRRKNDRLDYGLCIEYDN